MPHRTIDPIVVGSQLVGALQTIASRTIDPVESVVVSVTKFHGGDAYNVIPETVELAGTVRTLKKEVRRDGASERLHAICEGIAAAYGATDRCRLQRQLSGHLQPCRKRRSLPATSRRRSPASRKVHRAMPPVMGGEDFSYMLEARPGAFIFIGNGDTANLHHPAYDFNDEVIPHGVSYWVRLAETALAA